MLLTGRKKTKITIETPKGIPYTAELADINRMETAVSCAVKKDGGDDPDITTGTLIYARVCYGEQSECGAIDNDRQVIEIDGGVGVGRVTKPGLDQPVGNAAINRIWDSLRGLYGNFRFLSTCQKHVCCRLCRRCRTASRSKSVPHKTAPLLIFPVKAHTKGHYRWRRQYCCRPFCRGL